MLFTWTLIGWSYVVPRRCRTARSQIWGNTFAFPLLLRLFTPIACCVIWSLIWVVEVYSKLVAGRATLESLLVSGPILGFSDTWPCSTGADDAYRQKVRLSCPVIKSIFTGDGLLSSSAYRGSSQGCSRFVSATVIATCVVSGVVPSVVQPLSKLGAGVWCAKWPEYTWLYYRDLFEV